MLRKQRNRLKYQKSPPAKVLKRKVLKSVQKVLKTVSQIFGGVCRRSSLEDFHFLKWLVPNRPHASPPEARPPASSSPPRPPARARLPLAVSRSLIVTAQVPLRFGGWLDAHHACSPGTAGKAEAKFNRSQVRGAQGVRARRRGGMDMDCNQSWRSWSAKRTWLSKHRVHAEVSSTFRVNTE